ncbi:MAG: UDP-N-acetylglucosamine 1-carboxyvinyltransferase [Oscillospiraceae bacterium]|nr:UDP-N-acetylglucosamine 1-carboxyvinyltransferase [Oscillospiraceae bacterium]
MQWYEIRGGHRLDGTVSVHGAKNSVLPILCATLLNSGVSVIHNCPRLSDVEASVAILRHLGCQVDWEGDTVCVDATVVQRSDVPEHLMREMRSSVIFLGAILARTGEAVVSMPGGCELGPRPIDLHLAALERLGAEVAVQGGNLLCRGGRSLRGTEISLSLPSVGATENALLCACGAEGTTILQNAAREPEIVDLVRFLRSLGADIRGEGTSTLRIEGNHPLHSGEHTVIGDRIVAATYLSAAASAGGEVYLTGVDPEQLTTVTALLRDAGAEVRREPGAVWMRCEGLPHSVGPVRTSPYPGFPTDAQPVLMAALCRSRGTTMIVETMFENRYRHVDELRRMGADILVVNRVALITGVERLHGAPVEAHDLRGGGALAVAALGAEGVTQLSGLHHIRRGYASLPEDLRALGAEIRWRQGETTEGA